MLDVVSWNFEFLSRYEETYFVICETSLSYSKFLWDLIGLFHFPNNFLSAAKKVFVCSQVSAVKKFLSAANVRGQTFLSAAKCPRSEKIFCPRPTSAANRPRTLAADKKFYAADALAADKKFCFFKGKLTVKILIRNLRNSIFVNNL